MLLKSILIFVSDNPQKITKKKSKHKKKNKKIEEDGISENSTDLFLKSLEK